MRRLIICPPATQAVVEALDREMRAAEAEAPFYGSVPGEARHRRLRRAALREARVEQEREEWREQWERRR